VILGQKLGVAVTSTTTIGSLPPSIGHMVYFLALFGISVSWP
jgi:hypothetical protein